jgi:hypothetical protein
MQLPGMGILDRPDVLILKRVGIRRGKFHEPRRTAIGNWSIEGFSELEVMRLTGPADFRTATSIPGKPATAWLTTLKGLGTCRIDRPGVPYQGLSAATFESLTAHAEPWVCREKIICGKEKLVSKRSVRSLRKFAAVVLCSLSAVSVSAEEGFTPLFNGKDLTGWVPVGTPDAFTVKNGAIYATGAGPYPSWLRSDRQYENFVLRFEYQTQGWYEGGVLIHTPPDGPGSKLGLKIHLRHDRHEYGSRSPGAIYDVAAPRSIVNLPSGQWNRCEVECDWPLLRISLNGTLIHDINMDANDLLKYRLRRGFIGIQNIGCRAFFRDIQIRPLPDQEHWTKLLEPGVDAFDVRGGARWKSENDTLTGSGPDGQATTTRQFESPFELQVWVKTIVNGNGGVLFNCGGQAVEVQCFNAPDSTNPTGSLYDIAPARQVVSHDERWFLLQIFSDGPRAMVLVNGEKVCATDQLKPPYRGGIGFQQHTPGAVIQYRGARIKAWPDGFLK